MKTLNKVLFISAAVLALVSCNRKYGYDFTPYFTFNTSSAVISEDGGVLTLPVLLKNSEDGASVLVKLKDGSAKQNENFTLSSPANGVLTFAAGETQKNITIEIIDQAGVFTGALDFSVELAASGSSAEVGNFNTMAITITDNDHPLVAAGVAGVYTCNQTGLTASSGATSNYTFTVNLTTDPEDVTKIWCDAIAKMAYDFNDANDYKGRFSVYGTVSADFNTITFEGLQPVKFSTGYGTLFLQGGARFKNGEKTGYYISDDSPVPIVFTRTATGWETEDGFAFLDDYVWPSYGGYILGANDGCKTVWTRQ